MSEPKPKTAEVIELYPGRSLPVTRPPVQLSLFGGEAEVIPIPIDPAYRDSETFVDEEIALVKNDEGSQIILSGFGTHLGKKSERLIAKKSNKVIYEFPMFRLNEVVIASRGISFSSDLVEELCKRGIRLSFLSGGGRPYAMITSPALSGTVISKRQQFLAYNDERGVAFSRLVVRGKIRNQEKILRHFGKYIKKADPARFQRIDQIADRIKSIRKKAALVGGHCVDEARAELMALEGSAAKLYWEGVKDIIHEKAEFFGREHRGTENLVNALINYGYGILYSQVWGSILNAGLEPFAGFLHVDRPGKPSLVLDLVEEFRQPVVDRVVITHINLGEVARMKDGLLDEETRKLFAERILRRLETTEVIKGKKHQIRSIIQMQARKLCMFLRGESEYAPFTFKW